MDIYLCSSRAQYITWCSLYNTRIKYAHFLTTIRKVNSISTDFIINLAILLTGSLEKPKPFIPIGTRIYKLTIEVISEKIISGQGQELSETQRDPGNSENTSGSGNSSDDTEIKSWTIGQTGIPEIEYTDKEAERNRISEDIGSGVGSNRRYISPEKKSGSPSETIVLQPGNNLRGAASFSSNSGGAIGAWPSNEMTVKVTPMEVIL